MRATTFTQEKADEIIRRLSEGEPLAVICRDDHLPQKRTITGWKRSHPEFKDAVRVARKAGFDTIAWRSRLTIRGKGPDDGGESTGDVQRDKAIVDHDLKLLAKWDFERYGDRTKVSGDRKNPLGGMTNEQIEARLAELLAKKEVE